MPKNIKDHILIELLFSVTAVSGFSKPGSNYNIDNILRGQIGDDAYFIARHVDEWSQSDFHVTSSYRRQEPEPELVPSSSSSFSSRATSEPSGASVPGPIDGVRAPVSTDDRKGCADVIGVADGVGGWRAYGVDPGLFSNHLMRNCERLVKAGFFISNSPKALLEQVELIQICTFYFLHQENASVALRASNLLDRS